MQESKKKKQNTRRKLLKMIHALDKSLLPLSFSGAIIKALLPFIPIVGSAYVIDDLIASEWDQAITGAIIMIATTLIVGLVSTTLDKINGTNSMKINRLCNSQILLKAISLDYSTFEDKKNLEEFQAADYNIGHNGGFGWYILHMSEALSGLAGLITAIVIIFQLCLKEVKGDGFIGVITSRTGSFIIVTSFIVILAIGYYKLSQKVREVNVSVAKDVMDISQKQEYISRKITMDVETQKELRLYRMRGMIFSEWKKFVIESYDFYKKVMRQEQSYLLVTSLSNDAVLILAYLYVVVKTFVGAVTIGSFTRYVGAVSQMNTSLRKTIEAYNNFKKCEAYLGFYTDFIEKENILDTGKKTIEKKENHAYEFEFHNVTFRYPDTDEDILKNVSFKLNMKTRFAVVGRNGAGKTTMIKLLCRLYDVTEGKITLDGVDIREYDYHEYLDMFATVFQDFALFSIPIKENVACSNAVVEDDIWESLSYTGVDKKIDKLEKKLDTILYHESEGGEGVSGGEEQKIAIARALYKDAPFVILDEPTAALDPISEHEIYSHFGEMVKGKTSIFISHRMSSCRFCDDILVFDKGQLVQRGNHDTLMTEANQIYAKLWTAQAKYYAEAN
jgi:ATP-binding cassette subfamily B protein